MRVHVPRGSTVSDPGWGTPTIAVVAATALATLAIGWSAIDDLLWGRARRADVLARLSGGPKPGRQLTRGRCPRYVLLGRMVDEGLITEEPGVDDGPRWYRMCDAGADWLARYQEERASRRRSGDRPHDDVTR